MVGGLFLFPENFAAANLPANSPAKHPAKCPANSEYENEIEYEDEIENENDKGKGTLRFFRVLASGIAAARRFAYNTPAGMESLLRIRPQLFLCNVGARISDERVVGLGRNAPQEKLYSQKRTPCIGPPMRPDSEARRNLTKR
jgi:hypothetical protein